MSPCFVDTNVLLAAVRPRQPRQSDLMRQSREASRLLLHHRTPLYISPLSWTELLRVIGQHDSLIQHLEGCVHMVDLNRHAAKLAGELLGKLRRKQDVCSRCYSAKAGGACPACGRVVSAQQKVIDALIVATAELTKHVDTLYTFDQGMLSFAPLLTNCAIRTPPYFENIVAIEGTAAAAPR